MQISRSVVELGCRCITTMRARYELGGVQKMPKLAIAIILILAALFAWPFVEPALERWRRSRAAKRRRERQD